MRFDVRLEGNSLHPPPQGFEVNSTLSSRGLLPDTSIHEGWCHLPVLTNGACFVPVVLQVITAKTATYTREDMCGGSATTNGFHDPGLLHSAVLTGLEAGKLFE